MKKIMKKMKRDAVLQGKVIGTAVIFLAVVSISGCGAQKSDRLTEESRQSQNVTENMSVTESESEKDGGDVSTVVIPEGTKVIGFGEATHGNHELQILKKDLFEQIMNTYGTRVFVLEGDFGGCVKVNGYIHGGDGSAKDAVSEIGFAIYRTEEMEQLVEWMRGYNETVEASEQISFYGCDMQRFDNSKAILQDYLR